MPDVVDGLVEHAMPCHAMPFGLTSKLDRRMTMGRPLFRVWSAILERFFGSFER